MKPRVTTIVLFVTEFDKEIIHITEYPESYSQSLGKASGIRGIDYRLSPEKAVSFIKNKLHEIIN